MAEGQPPFRAGHTPFDAIGGEAQVRALVDAFYAAMASDAAFERVRRLHPADLAESREKLSEFLCGWMGGPPLYVQKHGHPRLRARHMPFAIGDIERDQWLACMARALDERGVSGELRAHLDARFRQVADFMRNA